MVWTNRQAVSLLGRAAIIRTDIQQKGGKKTDRLQETYTQTIRRRQVRKTGSSRQKSGRWRGRHQTGQRVTLAADR